MHTVWSCAHCMCLLRVTPVVTTTMIMSPSFFMTPMNQSPKGVTVHLWLEMARDGFMNKVVIEECGQVRTGREILEMKIL